MDRIENFVLELNKIKLFEVWKSHIATLASLRYVTSPKRHFVTRATPFHPRKCVTWPMRHNFMPRHIFFCRSEIFARWRINKAKYFRGLKRSGPCGVMTHWRSGALAKLRVEVTLLWRSDPFSVYQFERSKITLRLKTFVYISKCQFLEVNICPY